MANYHFTRLKCTNPEVVDAVVNEINFSFGYGSDFDEAWWPGDTEFYVCTRSSLPHDEVKKISKQFSEALITCHYSGSHTDFSEVWTVEHKAGEDNVVSLEPSYVPLTNQQYEFLDWDSIYSKAKAFFCRLDTTETDEKGNLFINWFDEEVTYKFRHNATDGKKYRIEATKFRWNIQFKVIEALVMKD